MGRKEPLPSITHKFHLFIIAKTVKFHQFHEGYKDDVIVDVIIMLL